MSYRLHSSALAAAACAALLAAPASAQDPNDAWIGEVVPFAGPYCPHATGPFGHQIWMPADGRVLPIPDYQAAFSLLGTTYGGDGRSTFALPDMRGRYAAGSGGELNWRIGQRPGQPKIELGAEHMPPHTHALRGSTEGPTSRSANGGAPATFPAGNSAYAGIADGPEMGVAMLGYTGGGQEIDLYQPFLVITYCVTVGGTYPSSGEEESEE
jgi:microcystin-dependent protein